jgi:hypothetical protein
MIFVVKKAIIMLTLVFFTSSACYGYQQRTELLLHIQDHHVDYSAHEHGHSSVSNHEHGDLDLDTDDFEAVKNQDKDSQNSQEPHHKHNTSVGVDNLWSESHSFTILVDYKIQNLNFSNGDNIFPSDYVSKLYRPPKS